MMYFVHTFSIMRAQGVRLIVIKKVRNYGKTVFIKKHVRKWLVGGIPPGSAHARTDNNVSYHYTNQPIWLQYDAGRILSQLF